MTYGLIGLKVILLFYIISLSNLSIQLMSTSLFLFSALIPFLLLFSSSSSSANDFASSFMASCNREDMKDGNSSIVSNFYCNCVLNYIVSVNNSRSIDLKIEIKNAQNYCIARTRGEFQQKAPTNANDLLLESIKQSGQTTRCMLTGNCN